MMKNYEQIRALNALGFWKSQENKNESTKGENNGDVVRGLGAVSTIPTKKRTKWQGENSGDVVRGLGALIINGGLLSTIAFAKDKGYGYETLMKEIGRFLGKDGGINIFMKPVKTLDDFIEVLTNDNADSLLLQRATSEAMAYLSYLKRFRIKKDEENDEE